MPDSSETQTKSVGGELILPVAALVFTLYYFSTIYDSPWTAQVAAFFVGAILLLLIVIFIGRVAVSVGRGEADLGMKSILEPLSFLPVRAGLIGLTILYTIAIDWGGFTLTSFVFMTAATLMLNRGRHWKRSAAFAACVSLAGYLLFIVAFEIRFPKGPFEYLVEALA